MGNRTRVILDDCGRIRGRGIVRYCAWILALSLATFVPLGQTGRVAVAAVKSVSPDGEATVYLSGAFSNDFDVAYRAVLQPRADNKSWSTLSILLVGGQIPGPGASVGVVSLPPGHRPVRAFTYVAYPSAKGQYESLSATCAAGCVIELRGDARNIHAYVDGKIVGSWSRSDLYLQHPSIQLNAEVHGSGDHIYASLTPVQTKIAERTLRSPTCALTTRGIEPAGRTTLTFRGTTNAAGGSFINLLTGARTDTC
jgi:hypothetical protein